MPDPVTRTTRDPVICPACGRNSLTPVLSVPINGSPDQIAIRCNGCRHVWSVSAGTPCVPPFPAGSAPIAQQPYLPPNLDGRPQ